MNTNLSRKTVIAVLTAVFALLILAGGVYLSKFKPSKTGRESSVPVPEASPTGYPQSGLPKDERVVTLSVISKNLASQNSEFSIKIAPEEPVTLSAVALRVKLDKLTYPNLTPEKVKIMVNSDFTEAGWAFPVRTVRLASEGRYLDIDLAAINATLSGYSLSGEESIATIIVEQEDVKPASLSFDQEETKIITKEGKEIKLNLSIK